MSDTAIDPCTDSRARTIQSVTQQGRAFDVNVGRFVADGNRLLTGTTLGIVMRNENGFGGGNDGAYDNIRVLDVTPQLDKSFSPQRVPVNGVSTLTLTVTNTSELGAKNGWAFTDNLPDGLVVADDPNLGGTFQATRTATPGTGTVEITDGVLAEGAQSCTVTVDVTSKSPTGSEASPVTYRNCAANFSDVVGMDLPNCASVEFYSEAKLQIEKTSDATSGTRVGDTVTYTIRATNVGDADYTNADPAVVGDYLTGVIDDATYNEDAKASVGSRPTYDEPRLRWSGPLKVDDSVTITYSVTLTGAGDRAVENVAWESCLASDPDCNPDPPQECVDNVDPATGRACDADQTFDVDGTVAPGDTVTVTYTVTVKPDGERGDDQLGNFLAQGDDQPPAECAADDPLCTNNPVGQVEHRKSVSPFTGTTVQPGETLTYTLRQGAVVVRRPGATRHAARGADGGGRPAPAVRPAPAHRGRGADACDGGARVESVPAEPLRDGGRAAAAPGRAREPESGHRGGRGAGARDTREGPRRPAPPPGGGCAAVRSGRGERTRPAGGARRHRADRDGERLRDGAQRRPRRPPRAAGRPAAGVPGRPPPVELAPGRGRSVGRPHPAGAGGPAAVRPSRVGRGGRPSAVGVGQHREEAARLVVREARRP